MDYRHLFLNKRVYCKNKLEASVGPVTALAFSGDGGRLYTARNGYVSTTGAKTPERVLESRIHGLFACDEGFLAWGERSIVLWSSDGREKWRGSVRLRAVEASCSSQGGIFVVDSSGCVARHSFGNPDSVVEWEAGLSECGDVGELRCASFRNGHLAGGDAFGRLATSIDGRVLTAEALHGGVVTSVGWSDSSEFLCSTSDDRGVRCWRIVSSSVLELVWCGVGHSARAWDAAFCSGDQIVVSCGQDGDARTWDANYGNALNVFKAHSGKHAWCVAISPKGFFATGGSDSTVRVWPINQNTVKLGLRAPATPTAVRLVSIHTILVACDTGTLYRVDVGESSRWTELSSHPALAAKCLETRNNLVAACGAPKGGWVAVCPFSSSEREDLVTWCATRTRVLGCWWISDDELVVSCADRTMGIWTRTGEKIGTLAGGNALAIDVTVHPSNPLILGVGDSRGRVTRFDREQDGATLPCGPRASKSNGISALSWVNGGNDMRCLTKDGRVVYLSEDGSKRLADVPMDHVARITRPPRASKPDVAGGFYEDRNFVVFDVETGRRLASLLGTSSNQSHDFFADDENVALAASADGGGALSYCRTSIGGSKDIGPFLVADGVAAARWISHAHILCSGGSGQLATYFAGSKDAPVARVRRLSPAVHAERAMAVTSRGVIATASKHELRIWDSFVVPMSTVVLGAPSSDRQDQRILAACAWHDADDNLVVALGDSAGIVTICDNHSVIARLQYDTSPVLSLSRERDKLFAGSTSGILVVWRLSDSQVVLAIQAHDAGVNALCSAPAATTPTSSDDDNVDCFGGILVATGGDDHALATLVVREDGEGAKFERILRDSPTPVVSLGLTSANAAEGCRRRLYVVSTDLRLCAFDIGSDATLFNDRRPTWRVASSIADSFVATLVLSIDLDLGDAKGLHIAPSSSRDDADAAASQPSEHFDRILVYGEGGFAIASCPR